MRTMWFGTRGFERWIKMPRIDVNRGQYGTTSRTDHHNGGTTIQNSLATHHEAVFEWNAITSEGAKDIRDVLDGLYSTDANGGLIYFIEPGAARLNAFSQVWAAPFISGVDGPSLTKGVRPTLTDTPANTFRLPARTATFTVTGESVMNTFYIPIPPGHTAHFAFYGPSLQSNKIQTRPYTSGTAGSASTHDVLANATYGAFESVTADGLEFSLAPTPGTVSITTALLQILPTGVSPVAPTTFISGGGHSGCKVDGGISQTLNRATEGRTRETLSARLVEQGAWL